MALGRNFNWAAAAETLGLDPEWYEDDAQMRADIQGRWDLANQEQRASFSRDMRGNVNKGPGRQAPVRAFGGNAVYGDHGLNQAFGGFNMAQAMSGQQAGHMGGMMNKTMEAIGDENDRRVAISREMRRMEHERWKMMQQMALAREKMQMDSANQIRALRQRASMANPTQTRTIRQDPMTGEYRWMEDWEL